MEKRQALRPFARDLYRMPRQGVRIRSGGACLQAGIVNIPLQPARKPGGRSWMLCCAPLRSRGVGDENPSNRRSSEMGFFLVLNHESATASCRGLLRRRAQTARRRFLLLINRRGRLAKNSSWSLRASFDFPSFRFPNTMGISITLAPRQTSSQSSED